MPVKINHFQILVNEAEKLGYFISSIRPTHHSNVNHTRKRIEIKRGEGELYEFCHELGHCLIHNKIKHRFLNEVVAWIVGIKFMEKARIPINKDYLLYALKCLKTYRK